MRANETALLSWIDSRDPLFCLGFCFPAVFLPRLPSVCASVSFFFVELWRKEPGERRDRIVCIDDVSCAQSVRWKKLRVENGGSCFFFISGASTWVFGLFAVDYWVT